MSDLDLDFENLEQWGLGTKNEIGVALFSNAVQVWSVLQERSTTVNEAALAFNVRPEIIRQAVEWHAWMYLDGDTIEHEGE